MTTTAELIDSRLSAVGLIASLECMAVTIRARRMVRLSDAAGINLRSARDLQERHLGIIRCNDARDAGAIVVRDPARVQSADLRREMAMRSRGIEKYLAASADYAEMIVILERQAHQGAIHAWRKSPSWSRMAKAAPVLVVAMRRALGGDIEREYGAARKLSQFLGLYEDSLKDFLTAYSHCLTKATP